MVVKNSVKFIWIIIHNCVAHPLLLLTILRSTKVNCVVNKFHDYTADRAYPKCDQGNGDTV